MKLQAKTRSVLLVMGLSAAGLVQADTTYTYTYDYSWSVNGCSGSWNANCGLTGTQSGSSVTPSPAPADPNAPSASIGAVNPAAWNRRNRRWSWWRGSCR
jgi:hypothetical protein